MIVTVLIGPSGVGKSTLLAATAQRCRLTSVPTVTTRPRRPGEDDTTHEFVSRETFAARRAAGQFLGTHRQYGHDYGLPLLTGLDDAHPPVVLCLRAAVVDPLRRHHPDLDVIALEAPVPVLLARLAARGDVDRADPVALQREAAAGRGCADLVLDATAPVAVLADTVAARIATTAERGR